MSPTNLNPLKVAQFNLEKSPKTLSMTDSRRCRRRRLKDVCLFARLFNRREPPMTSKRHFHKIGTKSSTFFLFCSSLQRKFPEKESKSRRFISVSIERTWERSSPRNAYLLVASTFFSVLHPHVVGRPSQQTRRKIKSLVKKSTKCCLIIVQPTYAYQRLPTYAYLTMLTYQHLHTYQY